MISVEVLFLVCKKCPFAAVSSHGRESPLPYGNRFHHGGLTFMTSFKPSYIPMALLPNIMALGIRTSAYGLGGRQIFSPRQVDTLGPDNSLSGGFPVPCGTFRSLLAHNPPPSLYTLDASSPLLPSKLWQSECLKRETSLVVQWLRLRAPSAGGPGSIPDHRTRSCLLQLRVCLP